MRHLISKTILIAAMIAIPGTAALAATTDGILNSVNEYSFNTEAAPNDKHNTDNHGTANSEYNDGSGGDRYDLNYLGVDISDGNFQFGVVGGSILTSIYSGTGSLGDPLYIGDIAINVLQQGETYVDPTQNTVASAGWDYAIRILSISGSSVEMQLLEANANSSWQGVDLYGYENNGNTAGHQGGHHSDTYRLNNATLLGDSFSGSFSNNGTDMNVLEGSFDLSLLSLFDEATGGSVITYLTMSCVNDEAIVYADIAAVPVPAAIWLFGSALIGFIGMSRRTKV